MMPIEQKVSVDIGVPDSADESTDGVEAEDGDVFGFRDESAEARIDGFPVDGLHLGAGLILHHLSERGAGGDARGAASSAVADLRDDIAIPLHAEAQDITANGIAYLHGLRRGGKITDVAWVFEVF